MGAGFLPVPHGRLLLLSIVLRGTISPFNPWLQD
jgi:hypothetical protein